MRTIVISDPHGCRDELCLLLKKVGYRPNIDALCLLGDYGDRGKHTKQTVQMVMSLSKRKHVKVIGGNHDDMFLNWLDDLDYKPSPYTNEKNGGTETILSYCPFFKAGENDCEVRNWIKKTYKHEIEFLRNLPDYIEDDNHIFVHAGVDPTKTDWMDTDKKNFRWLRDTFYDQPNPFQKTVVFGHTTCSVLHQDETNFNVWFSEGKIGIDGGVKFGGQLNALMIEGGRYSTEYVKVAV